MMQMIREKAHGVISWVIVGLIALAFCLVGITSYISNGTGPVAAIAYGKKISAFDVDNLYNRWLRYASEQKGFDINKLDPKYIKQQLTRTLAEQQAVVIGLDRDGFTISDTMLVANIQSDANLQEDGKFSIEKYKNLLRAVNVDESTFEQLRRDELLMTQAQQSILASSFALPQEALGTLRLMTQVRDFGYAVIPVANYKKSATVSEQAITDFYTKHAPQFMEPQQVKLEYVELAIDNLIPKGAIEEQKLREYYQNNLELFVEPELAHVRHIMIYAPEGSDAKQMADARSKIDALYAQLQAGANFAELAKKSSEDTQTAKDGGDLGWVSKNDSLPAEVYLLEKNGNYTTVVQTKFGWHIFQLVERKNRTEKDFATVKNLVEQRYKRDTAERAFSAAGEELANLAFENPKTLSVASEKLNLPIQTTEFITQQSTTGLASSKNVLNAAFSNEVLTQQNNSDLIRVSDDMYVVVRVSEVKPERQLSQAEVQGKIKDFLQMQAAQNKAKELGEELITEINQGLAPSKAAAKLKLEWKNVQKVTRSDRVVAPAILQQVFVLPEPKAEESPKAHGFSIYNGDFVIAQVTKVADGDSNAEGRNEMLADIGNKIAIMKGRAEYDSFQAALIDAAKIKYTVKE